MNIISNQHKKSGTKVLILYNKLFHYRVPIFNLLAEKYDLTVAYSIESSSNDNKNYNFKVIKLPIIQYKSIVFHKSNIYKLCKNFDVIIIYGDIKWIKYSIIPFQKKNKFKVIF